MLAGVSIGLILFVAGLVPKMRAQSQLVADAKEAASELPAVQLVTPHLGSDQDLILPASIQAIAETAVQARTSGYVSKLYVDIGSRVKQGQVLAEIQSPDVDQQVAQAGADTAKSQATVGQSIADVARLGAGVVQSRAEAARQRAGVKQAVAQEAGAQSKLLQAKADLSAAEAKVSQTKDQVRVQEANYAQAQAQYELAVATEKRYRKLLSDGFIAQQDYDQAAAALKTAAAGRSAYEANIQSNQADVEAAEGAVKASAALVQSAQADLDAAKENVRAAQAALEATLSTIDAAKASVDAGAATVRANRAQVNSSVANQRRFQVQRSFQRVVAPFDGVITSRNVDVGSLVTPGVTNEANATSPTPNVGLFGIARTNVVRIRVNLPQTYYQAAKPGSKVQVTIRELPNRVFEGTIAESAGALDATSRTLLTEVHLQNPGNLLLPGMYAQVRVMPSGAQATVRIPANTLIFDAAGTRVAVVGRDNVLHLKQIKEGRDFGQGIEVLSGVSAEDRLVSNPTDNLKDGQEVRPSESPK